MKKILLFCSIFLIGNLFVNAQVSKTNSTPLTISSGPASGTRTFTYTAGDFGGCTSLTEVEISITMTMGSGVLDCNAAGDPYSVQEDLALRLTSPTGTNVDLIFDKWDYFEPSLGNTLSSFVTVPISTVLFDDDAATLIGGDWNTFAGGSARPVEPLSAFDGENATGTWTLSMADGHSQFSTSDYFCITSATLTVTCGAACIDPTVPTVTYSPATVCNGNNATLNISGTLNDATAWQVYTGSCGGTNIGSTAGSSFVVTPGSPSTTYYVRGEGGCVTPGSCGTTTVSVTPMDDASFSYSASAYCVNAADPTPTITGLPGGTFSSTVGLSINASTGKIDVSTSTPSTYTVTYTTAGSCPNSSNVNVTINALDNASFSYGASAYCVNAADPTPTITGLGGGMFTSSPAGLSINASTGQVDVSASTPNTYTVTYTTAGSCPNSSDVNVTINALDNASFSYGSGSYCANDSDPTPTITGLSGGTFSSSPAGLSINSLTGTVDVSASSAGVYTITYTTAGTCPNSSNASLTIDNTAPTAVCQNISVYLDGTGNATIVAADIDGGSTDNCGGVTLSASQTTFTCADLGANNVTLTVTDGNSNTANCVAVVTVVDTTSPVITCPADVSVSAGAGTCGYTAGSVNEYYIPLAQVSSQGSIGPMCNPGTTDLWSCGNSLSISWNSIETVAPNAVEIEFYQSWYDGGVPSPTVFNGSANNDYVSGNYSCVNNVINYTLDPTGYVIGGSNSLTVNNPGCIVWDENPDVLWAPQSYAKVTVYSGLDMPVVSDNCEIASVSNDAPAVFPLGNTTVTWTAMDVQGNTSTCSQVVTVTENDAPTAVCQNINVYLDGTGNATIVAADIDGGSTDNCGGVTLSASQTTFTCADLGVNNVTLTVTDESSNTANCVAVVTVIDTTSPTVACQNINVYLDGTGNETIVAADIDGGSTDNCGGVSLSASQTTFTCADLGANNVTLTVTDGSSNTATCVAVVTVIDTTSPTISCPGNQMENPSASCQFTLPDYTGLVTASDNCTASPTVSQSPIAGTVITGNSTITMTVDDGNGNTSSCTFDVVLNDATAPTAVCQNISVYLDGSGNATIVAADIDGGSTDNCGGVTLSASQTTFTCADLGANNVTLTVTDGNSNTANCVAVVTVVDTTSPTISCPSDMMVCAGEVVNYTLPTGGDNCSQSVAQTDVTGLSSGMVFPTGVTTLEYTSTDGSGNTAVCTFTVTVSAIDNTIDNSLMPTLTSNQVGATYRWLDCDNGNAVIPSETGQSFTATVNGNYAVEITMGSCIDTSACENVTGVGVREINNNVVSIYPNPTSGLFIISLANTQQAISYKLTTLEGRIVEQADNVTTNNIQVDLTNESKGVYLLKLQENNTNTTYKIIKQ